MSIVDDDGLEHFATVRLTSDLSGLTVRERAMIPILIDAAERMDEIYWLEMFGPRKRELNSISDPRMRRRVEINSGPGIGWTQTVRSLRASANVRRASGSTRPT